MPTKKTAASTLQNSKDPAGKGSSLEFLSGVDVDFTLDPESNIVRLRHGKTETTVMAIRNDTNFKFKVPAALYPEPDYPYFQVCDTAVSARSFTVPERNKLIDLENELGLSELNKENQKLAQEWLKSFEKGDSRETLEGLRDNLKASKKETLGKTPKNMTELSERKAELQGIDDMLASIKVDLEALDKSPEEVAVLTDQGTRERTALNDQIMFITLQKVHLLATLRGETEEDYSVWQERVTLDDFRNAGKVLNLGNAGSDFTKEPDPLTKEQRRMLSMKRAKILN